MALEKIQHLTGLTPFERDYRQHRRGERTNFTRTQWRERGRWVTVTDDEAVHVIVTKAGHRLLLFGESQTEAA